MRDLHTILFVDDDFDTQEIVRLALETVGGFEVTVCGSGAEAIRRAPEVLPDLVLLDLVMPEMDGCETLRRLREMRETAATPVVLLTAKLEADEIEPCKELGAVGCIPKPFDPMTLSATLQRIWSNVVAARLARMRERLASRRVLYAASLPERIGEIEESWRRWLADESNEEALKTVHLLIHRLLGSAATFGFTAVSDRARALDTYLLEIIEDEARPDSEQREHIEAGISVLKKAAAAEEQPASASPRT